MHLLHAKKAAATLAAAWIQDGMTVGLGSGSTASYFIDALIERHRQGLNITAVASSHSSAERAQTGGLTIVELDTVTSIDITVDGADEVDPQKRMIKGKGGAHVREKILASASKELIVIIDETKLVPTLGKVPLPVEILPFGKEWTRTKIETLGVNGSWRRHEGTESLFVTENGHFLLDISFSTPLLCPEKMEELLLHIPGVVDTGFFLGLAGRMIIGYQNGTTKVIQ